MGRQTSASSVAVDAVWRIAFTQSFSNIIESVVDCHNSVVQFFEGMSSKFKWRIVSMDKLGILIEILGFPDYGGVSLPVTRE